MLALYSILASVSGSASLKESRDLRDLADRTLKPANKPNPIGTEHAPVDGKDGIPRAGPWVETSAERERKKMRISSDEEDVITGSSTSHQKLEELKGEHAIPQSNEGVMDDKSRSAPVEGTRGTEGGISGKSKSKDSINVEQKRPDGPKEQPPLPLSEKEKLKEVDGHDDSLNVVVPDTPKTLEKPADLPDRPYAIPAPGDPSSPNDNTIPLAEDRLRNHPSATRPDGQISNEEEDIVQPLHSLFLAFTMILVSEIGDKTFLVACLMAMRHDRLLVFSAAYGALVAMTVLSAVLGHAVPTLIPKWLTNFLASGLFLVFGIKMLLEARNIDPNEGVSEEMKEVEQELEEKEHEALRRSRRRSSVSPYILESGRGGIRKGRSDGRLPSPPDSPISESSSRSGSPSRRPTLQSIAAGVNNLFSLLLSPAWVQTFVMTFLGEWGDRSQIATIAMAAGSDYWWVTAGALGGHAICTGVAVLGGKAIAGKVSLRTGKSPHDADQLSWLTKSNSDHGRSHCLSDFWCCIFIRSDILSHLRSISQIILPLKALIRA